MLLYNYHQLFYNKKGIHKLIRNIHLNKVIVMKKIFFRLAVVMIAIFLTNCRKETFVETLPVKAGDGLYLKSATAGEMALVQYLKDGKIEDFKYPNNILFKISGSQAEVLTQKMLLRVKNFDFLSNNKVMFLVTGFGSLSDPYMNGPDILADRLPFLIEDYGLQSADGPAKFNGVLKAENYVFAIKDGRILIYDLMSSRGNKMITAQGSVQNDVLTFKVGTEIWALKFIENSPVGNIFKLTIGDATFNCYSLS